jgi:tetratricopeptide (TPR) repeat protein
MAGENLPTKVLIVDDDPSDLKSLENILSAHKITVVLAKDWTSALYQYNHQKIDLAIVELELSGMPGTVLIQKWRGHEAEHKRDCAFVITTGKGRSATDEALITEVGDVVTLNKPFKPPIVLGALAQAMALKNQREQLASIRTKLILPFLQQKKFDKAAQVAAEKLIPIGPKGRFAASRVFEEIGDLPKALATLNQLAEQDPRNMSYLNEIGRLNMQMGNLEAAKKAYERADELAPHNLQRINEMATMYLSLKEPENSINKMRQLLNLTPEDTSMKFDLYQKLMNAGYEEHAQKFCNETSTPMELIRHYNNKGVLFSKNGDFVSAIDEYKKAIKLIPKSSEIYRIKYNMAIAHINLKYYDHIVTADELLEECLVIKPDFEKAKEKLEITKKYLAKKPA